MKNNQGYNENFGNYRADGLLTRPDTPRFRIGLAHADNETDVQRSDMDFEACVIRVEDESGDRVFSHDAATVPSNHGTLKLVASQKIDDPLTANTVQFSNVRINDDDLISTAIQDRTEDQVPFTRAGMYPVKRPCPSSEPKPLTPTRPATSLPSPRTSTATSRSTC